MPFGQGRSACVIITMAVNKSDLSRTRKLATTVLKLKGTDPDQWLYDQYQAVIDENTDIIVKALGQAAKNPLAANALNNANASVERSQQHE
ncbi:hypothetical protein FD01_GL000694 [Lacticaseibacillus manihotivorans DSM 13343 = JCM 12514]|uniref:Uncharacterized protein n=1 Tax=Lacticaseibacillus manihotivorans DSM 13343 = JCM 12514 TaxID=1423769 RepID=A0A0R1QRW5_9LACO|nr:hypothetical protein FD01_GL000694 [Lacticaseibacillus manihotivorans DSM 13343 = JCM 12514]